jgi:predicted transcriptional regulator
MKKIRVAVVGPQDSVALITEVAQEQQAHLKLLPAVYQDATEVPKIIAERDHEVDVWLFSGIVPYTYALTAKATSKLMLYVPHTGTSLYRVLLQVLKEGLKMDRISFDTLSRTDIIETFMDTQLQVPEMYVKEYTGIIVASDITEYHYDLWTKGKTSLAVTCLFSTYLDLQKRGVPCLRIWPTRNNIRTILEFAISRMQAIRYKGGQIAIQHISIDNYEDFVRNATSSYAIMKVELQLYEILVNYTEQVQGTIVIHGNGQYTIYSTRGVVEEATQGFTCMPVQQSALSRLPVDVSGGIGFGETANAANENAHVALGLARQSGKSRWVTVLDDKTVIGPLNSETELVYSIRTNDNDSRELAKKLNLSGTTINKLMAVCQKLDGQVITADILARYLSVTPRSARRLLASLLAHGLASVAGEEAAGSGRPRKLYEIVIGDFIKTYPSEPVNASTI